MSLQAPEKVRKLQNTLHAKAKGSPDFRFYVLYDKLYREDILEYAYRCCKANSGAAGVDKIDFIDIETYGKDKWLGELAEELRNKTYQAEAIRRVTSKPAMQLTRRLMDKLKLTINEQKTSTRHLPEETIEFLGYEIGVCYSTANGKRYIGTRPSRKRIQRICRKISDLTRPQTGQQPIEERIGKLNRLLRGWANYFCLGPVSKAYRIIDAHTQYRIREWLRHKHKTKGRGTARYPNDYLYDTLGLIRLELTTRNLPWAKA